VITITIACINFYIYLVHKVSKRSLPTSFAGLAFMILHLHSIHFNLPGIIFTFYLLLFYFTPFAPVINYSFLIINSPSAPAV